MHRPPLLTALCSPASSILGYAPEAERSTALPRGPATHTGLACPNGESGRSGSTAPIDCANRGAELRCVASPASKGRPLGRTGSLARAHASVLRSLGIRRSASPAEGWSGIGAVLLTVRAAAEGRIVSAISPTGPVGDAPCWRRSSCRSVRLGPAQSGVGGNDGSKGAHERRPARTLPALRACRCRTCCRRTCCSHDCRCHHCCCA